jgi:hypothetical protein
MQTDPHNTPIEPGSFPAQPAIGFDPATTPLGEGAGIFAGWTLEKAIKEIGISLMRQNERR